jgi:hypothetical protein
MTSLIRKAFRLYLVGHRSARRLCRSAEIGGIFDLGWLTYSSPKKPLLVSLIRSKGLSMGLEVHGFEQELSLSHP